MASLNRTQKIKQLHQLLRKRYQHVPMIPARAVLEHLIYAALLEHSNIEQADTAFSVLEHHYIDWNEVRVSTANELASTFPQLSEAAIAGDRIRKTLQAVFETTYMYDLEELKKKNLSQSVEYLESIAVCSRFMIDYTVQNALGGHVIPISESGMRVFRLLGLTQVNKEQTKEEVPTLERAIAKNEGVEFATLLHLLGVEHTEETEREKLRAVLVAIDSQVHQRDCAAPELIVIKPVKATYMMKPKPQLPPIAVSTSDMDDDLDTSEELSVTEEVEFIPNPITGEEISYDSSDHEEGEFETVGTKSRKGKEKEKSKEKGKTKELEKTKETGKSKEKEAEREQESVKDKVKVGDKAKEQEERKSRESGNVRVKDSTVTKRDHVSELSLGTTSIGDSHKTDEKDKRGEKSEKVKDEKDKGGEKGEKPKDEKLKKEENLKERKEAVSTEKTVKGHSEKTEQPKSEPKTEKKTSVVEPNVKHRVADQSGKEGEKEGEKKKGRVEEPSEQGGVRSDKQKEFKTSKTSKGADKSERKVAKSSMSDDSKQEEKGKSHTEEVSPSPTRALRKKKPR
ncbi:MAG: hypothetical protein ACRC10_02800 [Thermoguttaceae bacterium]